MAKTYELIGSVVSTSQPTLTISSIPSTYTDLKVVFTARSDRTNPDRRLWFYFNGSYGGGGPDYGIRAVGGTNTTTAGSYQDNNGSGGNFINGLATNADDGSTFSSGEFYIYKYANTSQYKYFNGVSVLDLNVSAGYLAAHTGSWLNTAAINSVTLSASNYNLMSGSSLQVYGIMG